MSDLSKVQIVENYNSIKKRIEELKNNLSLENNTLLIPVSKTHPIDIIKIAIKNGINVFGESYAQELKQKHETLEQDNIQQPIWHFIGHLQRNKVKYIAPFVNMIHTVDSLKLANEINKQALKNNRTIDILLQVNTSGEENKFGVDPSNLFDLARNVLELKNLNLKGLMTITGLDSSNEERINEFKLLGNLKKQLESELEILLPELSMGMSGDYEEAINQGSTMVRVGTSIFGKRNYN